jgi:hypothetical protein
MTDKYPLGLAGEYAVASELCRRGLYAQLTLGNLKQTDILLFDPKHDRLLRIEAKAKKKNAWPFQVGISSDKEFLVFVDFYKKEDTERADFYILTAKDWEDYVNAKFKSGKADRGNVEVDRNNRPIYKWKGREPISGTTVKPAEIADHKEKWEKIINAVR